MLEVRGLSRRFGSIVVFGGVDVDLRAGEVLGLIGPNGAGKSTFINCVTGSLAPDSGTVSFDGVPVIGRRPDQFSRMGLARTFQDPRLLEHRTAFENVLLGRRVKYGVVELARLGQGRRTRAHEERVVLEVLDQVGCRHLADIRAGSLSAGQQRLVSVARAMAGSPRCLLLDEPAAGLNDTETAALLENLRIIRGTGVAILLVEHHMGLVMEVCDRVTVLANGGVIAEGAPDEVRRDPEVIRSYLGSAA